MWLLSSALPAFAAFLHFDELSKLCCCDVVFGKDSMSIHIVSSKTDQYRKGDTVLVAWTGLSTCPVAVLERYVAVAEIDLITETCLFRGNSHTKRGEHLCPSGAMSYTHMRELFLSKLSKLGCDPKQFGWHSLRAGGATAAANAGVPDCLFKRHGQWRSESAKDGYIEDYVDSCMAVSKRLDLWPALYHPMWVNKVRCAQQAYTQWYHCCMWGYKGSCSMHVRGMFQEIYFSVVWLRN